MPHIYKNLPGPGRDDDATPRENFGRRQTAEPNKRRAVSTGAVAALICFAALGVYIFAELIDFI